jgi:hypothetical protein
VTFISPGGVGFATVCLQERFRRRRQTGESTSSGSDSWTVSVYGSLKSQNEQTHIRNYIFSRTFPSSPSRRLLDLTCSLIAYLFIEYFRNSIYSEENIPSSQLTVGTSCRLAFILYFFPKQYIQCHHQNLYGDGRNCLKTIASVVRYKVSRCGSSLCPKKEHFLCTLRACKLLTLTSLKQPELMDRKCCYDLYCVLEKLELN